MAILSHGSDLTLAPTIRPVVGQAGGAVQGAVDQLASAGFTAVQLDATLPGIRPRDLDSRARKDLAALLGRAYTFAAGLDLFIPRRHFTQPENVDRAMSAVIAAITLAADLGKIPVSVSLPVKGMSDDTKAALVDAADGHGLRLAVHAEDQLDALLAWIEAVDLYALGGAIDPAAVMSRSGDPAAMAQKLGRRLVVARLDDLGMTSGEAGDEGDDDMVRGRRRAQRGGRGRPGPDQLPCGPGPGCGAQRPGGARSSRDGKSAAWRGGRPSGVGTCGV